MDTARTRNNLQDEVQRLTALQDDIQADSASEQQQREISLTTLEQLEAELSDIENALSKLEKGTYGSCEACGEPISEERLQAQPSTRFCVDDQARAENELQVDVNTVTGPSPSPT